MTYDCCFVGFSRFLCAFLFLCVLCGLFEFYIGPWDWGEQERLVPCKWNGMELLALTLAILSLFLFRVSFMVPVELEVCSSKWLCGQKYISLTTHYSHSSKHYRMMRRIKLLWSPSWITALLWQRGLHNWRKLWQYCADHPRWTGLIEVFWQSVAHWKREWQTTAVLFPQEPHGQYKKAKIYDTRRWDPKVKRCSICYWERVKDNY